MQEKTPKHKMTNRIIFFLTASALSTICSTTLLAVTATRATTPIYIAWLTTSLALVYICLCFAAATFLRSTDHSLEAQSNHQVGGATAAVLRDSAAIEAAVEEPRNTYSLSTFYWW